MDLGSPILLKDTCLKGGIGMSRQKHLKIPKVQKLIEDGKKAGTLTHKEVMDTLQDVELTPDEIDDIYEAIEQMGIELLPESGY